MRSTRKKEQDDQMTTNNIHGCYEERKYCKPDSRGTPFRKRKQPKHGYPHPHNKVINTPKKQENNLEKRIMMWTRMGKYALVNRRGGVGYR